MEKKEAGIRCSGCGKAYKVKVPVTDKPVSFKCKKCGKVLKIRVKSADQEAPAAQAAPAEAGQDFGDFGAPQFEAPPEPGGPPSFEEPSGFDGGPEFEPPAGPGEPAFDGPPSFDSSPLDDSQGGEAPSFEAPSFEAPQFEAPGGFESDRFDAPEQGPAGGGGEPPPEFETTQLPDEGDYQSTPGTGPVEAPAALEQYDFTASPASPELTPATAEETAAAESNRRWVILEEDQVKGPFSEDEIRTMIQDGEVTADTSMRMGERPWIRAAEVAVFREMFSEAKKSRSSAVASVKLLDEDAPEEEAVEGGPFYQNLGALAPYPLGGGTWQPLALFAAISFSLSVFLCLDFMLGLIINVAGWIILYGYLATLMTQSWRFPNSPPPDWHFSGQLASAGAKVFLVLFLFSLLPVTLCLLAAIYFILNDMALFGMIFLALMVLVYLVSLYVVPASLVTLTASDQIGLALKPAAFGKFVTKGGRAYQMLGVVSVVIGLICLVTAAATSLVLVEIPMAGFVVGALVIALVFSYAHFVWFHVVGRYARENKALARQVIAAMPA